MWLHIPAHGLPDENSNVVPQWQRINNGNWRTVEEAVRSAARRRGVTFQVFTGTIGVFKVRQLQFNSS